MGKKAARNLREKRGTSPDQVEGRWPDGKKETVIGVTLGGKKGGQPRPLGGRKERREIRGKTKKGKRQSPGPGQHADSEKTERLITYNQAARKGPSTSPKDSLLDIEEKRRASPKRNPCFQERRESWLTRHSPQEPFNRKGWDFRHGKKTIGHKTKKTRIENTIHEKGDARSTKKKRKRTFPCRKKSPV